MHNNSLDCDIQETRISLLEVGSTIVCFCIPSLWNLMIIWHANGQYGWFKTTCKKHFFSFIFMVIMTVNVLYIFFGRNIVNSLWFPRKTQTFPEVLNVTLNLFVVFSALNFGFPGSCCCLCGRSFESPCYFCKSCDWSSGWRETNCRGILAEFGSCDCCTWSSSHSSNWFHQWKMPLWTLTLVILSSSLKLYSTVS